MKRAKKRIGLRRNNLRNVVQQLVEYFRLNERVIKIAVVNDPFRRICKYLEMIALYDLYEVYPANHFEHMDRHLIES